MRIPGHRPASTLFSWEPRTVRYWPFSKRLRVALVGGGLAGGLAFVLIGLILAWQRQIALDLGLPYGERSDKRMLTGFFSFWIVGGSILVGSLSLIQTRLTAIVIGVFLAGFLGFFAGLNTVYEGSLFSSGGLEDRQYQFFLWLNLRMGCVAGGCLGLMGSLISGVSLFLLFSRRKPEAPLKQSIKPCP